MTTPKTASNSNARKRLAEQSGTHTKHWDPAVVQLIEQARAEGAAEVVARVSELLRRAELQDRTSLSCDFEGNRWSTPISQDDLRAALRGPR